ncbi:MAG: HDOD domain-containing protein [Burkholderiales bacterium]|nr:HDOD domain-containing protein [Burkholderiales bacterium]
MPQPQFTHLEEQAENFVRKLDLPPCPEIIADIVRELRRDVPDVQKIAGWVSRDVAAAAGLLKTVNSAWYGIAAKARSVQQAIAYLGLDRTALLLAGLLLRNAFPSSSRPAMRRFWQDSTELALTTGFLARVLDAMDRDEAHTFGLFRDAGIAVLISKFPEYDPLALASAADGSSSVTDLEQARFGVDHAVIGSVLARDWQLPPEMFDAILWHHADFVLDMTERPIEEAAVRLIALGTLADRVLERYRGLPRREATAAALGGALRTLSLSEAKHADLELEAMSMLEELDCRPMPTLRLRAVASR